MKNREAYYLRKENTFEKCLITKQVPKKIF